jgi:ribosomal-protein-alanine N-acetyltransferase
MPDYADPHAPGWTLESERLRIRPLQMADLDAVHAIMVEGFGRESREERAEWLAWTVRSYTALARLHQLPYGERAIVLKASATPGEVIGLVGLVPSYGPFGTLPALRDLPTAPPSGLYSPEIGLFWALREMHRGNGYATEAARTLIAFAFGALNLKRIVATTDYDNAASIAVMQRLGMTVERNPHPAPAWFQVVGVLAQ